MMIKRTCKAMCGGGETFIFEADTIEDFISMIAEEAEKSSSCFSYHDAAAMFDEEIMNKLDKAANAAKGLAIRIKAKAAAQQES